MPTHGIERANQRLQDDCRQRGSVASWTSRIGHVGCRPREFPKLAWFMVRRMTPISATAAGCDVNIYGPDIYTEPDAHPDTLANLGPLRPMAGVWEGAKGADQHPVFDGLGADTFVEHYEAQPIDPQTNGPQLFYGLRYHTHIVKP